MLRNEKLKRKPPEGLNVNREIRDEHKVNNDTFQTSEAPHSNCGKLEVMHDCPNDWKWVVTISKEFHE